MLRFLGVLLMVFAIAVGVVHHQVGLHRYVNEAARYLWGPYVSEGGGSVVAEGFTYMALYFIGLLGLALVGFGKRKR